MNHERTSAEIALDIAKTISLQHPIYDSVELRWSIENRHAEYLDLAVSAVVPDRNMSRIEREMKGRGNWTKAKIYMSDRIAMHMLLVIHEHARIKEMLVHRARTLLRNFLLHELDEMLLVDDIRVFDPHKDEKT